MSPITKFLLGVGTGMVADSALSHMVFKGWLGEVGRLEVGFNYYVLYSYLKNGWQPTSIAYDDLLLLVIGIVIAFMDKWFGLGFMFGTWLQSNITLLPVEY